MRQLALVVSGSILTGVLIAIAALLLPDQSVLDFLALLVTTLFIADVLATVYLVRLYAHATRNDPSWLFAFMSYVAGLITAGLAAITVVAFEELGRSPVSAQLLAMGILAIGSVPFSMAVLFFLTNRADRSDDVEDR